MPKRKAAFFTLVLIVSLILPLELTLLPGDHIAARDVSAAPAVIPPEVEALFEDGGHVQVLVKLSRRADTARAARDAVKNLPPAASQREIKQASGKAVVAALKETARISQKPVLEFLKKFDDKDISNLKTYYIVNVIYMEAAEEVIRNLAAHPEVEAILPNSRIYMEEPLTDNTEPAQTDGVEWNIARIRAPEVWDSYGVDGSGVVVGIIDTGVSWEHEALKEKWRGFDPHNPDDPNPDYNWYDPVYGRTLPHDIDRHGTHVTGTIVGSGPEGGSSIGAAPGARWVAVNAFTKLGNKLYATDVHLLAAGEYLLAPTDSNGENPRPDLAPDIINNSWGGGADMDEWFREMVQNWRAAEILPVFSAGNTGPEDGTIVVPANYPESLAVAATNSDNLLASFSGRGPGPYPGIKPEISAPGVYIRSSVPGGGYATSSGTSMAAPHISGAAALLLSGNTELTMAEIESILLATAVPLTDGNYPESPNYGYGYGLVDVLAAAEEVFYEVGGPVGVSLALTNFEQYHQKIQFGQTEFESIEFCVEVYNGLGAVQEVEIKVFALEGDWEGSLVWPGESDEPADLDQGKIAFQFSEDGNVYAWFSQSGQVLEFDEDTENKYFRIKAYVGEGTHARQGPVIFQAALR